MRLLRVSATYTFPLPSTATPVGPLNCPPRIPPLHFVRKVPQGGVHCAAVSLAVVSSSASARQLRMNSDIRFLLPLGGPATELCDAADHKGWPAYLDVTPSKALVSSEHCSIGPGV